MFIISLTYIKPIEEVDKHLAAHVEFLKEQYANKKFITSGRKIPRTGGIIISNANSLEEVKSIITHDPFYINNIANYEITEFIPSMAAEGFNGLLPFQSI